MFYFFQSKSELIGTKPNKIRPNITLEEAEALETLIKLQRESVIVIKACDKGARISICNYSDYKDSCENHLASKTETGESKYKEVHKDLLNTAKEEIRIPLKSAKDSKIITDNEFEAMDPTDKKAGRFYQLLKVRFNNRKY